MTDARSALLPVYPRLDLTVVRAEGTTLFTDDGREILDLYGAHAVCPLGHAHPAMVDALSHQVRTLDFYSNSLHLPIQEEAARAVLGGSAHLAYAHFVNSGTEANESAIHVARRFTGRQTVVTLAESFHGRTLGSLTLTGLPGYRSRVPVDVPESWGRTIGLGDEDLSAIDETVAAVMIESVVSLGGVHMPPDGWLAKVEARCREVGALLLLDEVQGGVGRLGTWWGHETLGCTPDLVTLAKSVGGGFPVGVLAATDEIGDWIGYSELGTTFGGGPMACAAVKVVAEQVQGGLIERVPVIARRVCEGLGELPGVQLRGRGALLGIQTPRTAKDLRDAFLAHDILVGVSGDPHTIRLLPPYIVTDAELDRFVQVATEVLGG